MESCSRGSGRDTQGRWSVFAGDESAQYHAELLLLLGLYVIPIYLLSRVLVRLLFALFLVEAAVWDLPFF